MELDDGEGKPASREVRALLEEQRKMNTDLSKPTYPWYDGKLWEENEGTADGMAQEGRQQDLIWRLFQDGKAAPHGEQLPAHQNQAARGLVTVGERKGCYYVRWTANAASPHIWVEEGEINNAAVQAWDAKAVAERKMRRRP